MTASRMMMFLLSKAPPLQGRGWGGGGIHLAQDSRAHPVATIEQARKSHCPSPEGEGRILSDEELADPFGDQRRLVLALDINREFERLLPLAREFLVQFQPFAMAAHALARAAIGRASCGERVC